MKKSEKIITVVFAIVAVLQVACFMQNYKVLDNQRDIDYRLTRLEQDGSVVDSTIVRLYQRLNETMFDQVWIRRDIRQIQDQIGQ